MFAWRSSLWEARLAAIFRINENHEKSIAARCASHKSIATGYTDISQPSTTQIN